MQLHKTEYPVFSCKVASKSTLPDRRFLHRPWNRQFAVPAFHRNSYHEFTNLFSEVWLMGAETPAVVTLNRPMREDWTKFGFNSRWFPNGLHSTFFPSAVESCLDSPDFSLYVSLPSERTCYPDRALGRRSLLRFCTVCSVGTLVYLLLGFVKFLVWHFKMISYLLSRNSVLTYRLSLLTCHVRALALVPSYTTSFH